MLCFVFSALVVLLDQLFKRWAVIALPAGDITLIPKILGLTYVENTGAALGLLPNSRWVLAAVSLVCIILLIFILLRYNDGFWSRLGLAAVLGGAAGNMLDRVFRGYVVDMFDLKFFDINLFVFNIADLFITLGGITFLIFFLISSFKKEKTPEDEIVRETPERTSRTADAGTAPEPLRPRVLPNPSPQQQRPIAAQKPAVQDDPPPFRNSAQKPEVRRNTDTDEYSDYVKGLSETRILEEFDLDRLLSEYGVNDDEN